MYVCKFKTYCIQFYSTSYVISNHFKSSASYDEIKDICILYGVYFARCMREIEKIMAKP